MHWRLRSELGFKGEDWGSCPLDPPQVSPRPFRPTADPELETLNSILTRARSFLPSTLTLAYLDDEVLGGLEQVGQLDLGRELRA